MSNSASDTDQTEPNLYINHSTNRSLKYLQIVQVGCLVEKGRKEKMDFELRRAREKLEKEQKERKERARVKLDRDRKAKEEARKQREAIEAVHRSRRLDAIQAQLKVPPSSFFPSKSGSLS